MFNETKHKNHFKDPIYSLYVYAMRPFSLKRLNIHRQSLRTVRSLTIHKSNLQFSANQSLNFCGLEEEIFESLGQNNIKSFL